MLATMTEPKQSPQTKRPRRAYDVEDRLHNALDRRAAKLTLEYRRKVSISEALAEILADALLAELGELADEPTPPPRRRRK